MSMLLELQKALIKPRHIRNEIYNLLESIYQLICHTGGLLHLSYYWIKAHVGIPNNELADQEAKKGANPELTHRDIISPATTLKKARRTLDNLVLFKFTKYLKTNIEPSHLPNAPPRKYFIDNKPFKSRYSCRHVDIQQFRIRSGH